MVPLFWSFSRFRGYFKGFQGILVILVVSGCFSLFRGSRVILVILEVLRIFGPFWRLRGLFWSFFRF